TASMRKRWRSARATPGTATCSPPNCAMPGRPARGASGTWAFASSSSSASARTPTRGPRTGAGRTPRPGAFAPARVHLRARARVGVYRNADVSRAMDLGALGYGAEAGVGWKFTRDLKLEFAALRDARLNDVTVAQQVDRNVFQLRLTWEKARFE